GRGRRPWPGPVRPAGTPRPRARWRGPGRASCRPSSRRLTDGEHLFDQTSILPEQVFAVNLLNNIELVFASGPSALLKSAPSGGSGPGARGSSDGGGAHHQATTHPGGDPR